MRIVVIISDTFRFDHVAAHGRKAVHTPHLDDLARRGADFQRAYAGSFPTGPNRADVYLGRTWFPRHPWSPLPTDVPTLAERVVEAGYVTQWIGDNPHLMKNNAWYTRGFSAAVVTRGQEGDMYFTRLNKPHAAVQPVAKTRRTPVKFGMTLVDAHEWQNEPRYEADRFCCRTADLACRWLEENYKHKQWMLWLEMFDVHEPWDPPEYLWRRYDPDYAGPEMRHPNYGPASEYTKAELRNLAAHYAGEATLVDKSIGRILRQIDDCGIADDTAIVFTTDRGICLGEHNRTGKSNLHPDDTRPFPLYEQLSHIPLIVYVPGARPRRPRQIVQPVDTAATILQLAGAKADKSQDGASLLDLVRGKRSTWRRDWAISSAHLGHQPWRRQTLPMFYTGRWAYCPRTDSGGPAGMLFDMAADPEQRKSLVKSRPAVASRLRDRMRKRLEAMDVTAEQVAELFA